MPYIVYITPTAGNDLASAITYYNSQSEGLGNRVATEVDALLHTISIMPSVFSKRYGSIRAAKVRSFPYLIFYTINEKNKAVNVLRVFNTYQNPVFG
jgi:mRNA-degrading endonuclease RelE of RelBE toxin-antitoxin system